VVRGLAIFQEWFKDFENQYVLIGGTAASITMEEAGVPFRGTKDLDIVLHVEVLTPAFGQKFWKFVRAGGYQQKEGDPFSARRAAPPDGTLHASGAPPYDML